MRKPKITRDPTVAIAIETPHHEAVLIVSAKAPVVAHVATTNGCKRGGTSPEGPPRRTRHRDGTSTHNVHDGEEPGFQSHRVVATKRLPHVRELESHPHEQSAAADQDAEIERAQRAQRERYSLRQ